MEQTNIWQKGTLETAERDIARRIQNRGRVRGVSPELEELVRGDLFAYLKERNVKLLRDAAARLEIQDRSPANPFETFGILLDLSRQSLGAILLEEERMAFLAKESADPVARRVHRVALAILREEMAGAEVDSYHILCERTGGMIGKLSRRTAAQAAASAGAGYRQQFFPSLKAMQRMQSIIYMRLARVKNDDVEARKQEKERIVEVIWVAAHWNRFLRFITDAGRRREELAIFSRYLGAAGTFEAIAAQNAACEAVDKPVCFDERVDQLVGIVADKADELALGGNEEAEIVLRVVARYIDESRWL